MSKYPKPDLAEMTVIQLKQYQDFYETKISEYHSNVAAVRKELKRRRKAARVERLVGGDKIRGLSADYVIIDDIGANSVPTGATALFQSVKPWSRQS